MTTQVQSIGVAGILKLVQDLSPFDKALLLSAIAKDTGFSVVLSSRATPDISMQISGLDNAGMADIMTAIASALREQIS